ncbi:MAG: hypothetical protein PUI52_06155, partial [Bacteroidales bacterium]|nr:hypothetical protein [Bacteroidales bacterium]MDY6171174.1 hypothetical protein [Candidatus Cryptobacteroides sp.]
GLVILALLVDFQSTCRAAYSRCYLCLGAPPSFFALAKYTAPAVALVREYVVVFWGIVWGFF